MYWLILLGQMESVPVKGDWLDHVMASGPTGALTFAVAALIGSAAYVIIRFGPRVATAHANFVESAQVCNVDNAKQVRLFTDSFVAKMDPKGDPKFDGHNFSTVHTNNALGYLAQAVQELSVGHAQHDEVVPLIEKALKTLRKSSRNPDSDVFPVG